MPRPTCRAIDERARARLRDAQRGESDAVALVHAAVINKELARAKLDAVIAKHQVAIDEADHELSKAQTHLVSVSGIERAALLVDQCCSTKRTCRWPRGMSSSAFIVSSSGARCWDPHILFACLRHHKGPHPGSGEGL